MFLVFRRVVVNFSSKNGVKNCDFLSNRIQVPANLRMHSTLPLTNHQMVNQNLANVKSRINDITKSKEDKDREYRGLQLNNGLKVLLISDPGADKGAACLSVEIGHMSDPDIPGLAHFVEHLLFLGTSKFPNENDYTAFLNEHGGSSNAATYPDNTKYYFDVKHDKLREGLERFAEFFISPLFTESAVDREINAVNSEHEKNWNMDNWRIRQVNKSLAEKTHAYHKFGTGNSKTLRDIPREKGINVRDEVMKFHKQWYSANIMSLAVFGKESLDDLESMVAEMFSRIENKNVVAPKWTDFPFADDKLRTKVFVVPVKDTRSLTITFQTEDMDKYYRSGPDHYLSHLIGHESNGSVLSELKRKGFCSYLMAGYSTAARGFGFFEIMVDLTEEGFENVDEIIKTIFQYINMLKRDGTPQKYIFDEYQNISEMHFRFKEKENPIQLVSSLVHSMQIYPLNEVLIRSAGLISEWEPEIITDLWDQLVPEKAKIAIVGKNVGATGDKVLSEEFWYGTKFYCEKIPQDTINDWIKCGYNENLYLPDPNPFVPTDFNIMPTADQDKTSHPQIILDTPTMRVWFKQDSEYLKPKTLMNYEFSSPLVYLDPLNCNLSCLFVQLFKDQLTEYLYSAEIAGLQLGLSNTTYGITLTVSGYSHKQKVLLEKVLDELFHFSVVDEKRFDILKEQYVRGLKNFKMEQPYQHAVYYLALLLTENAWTKKELLDATVLLTVEKLNQFIKELISRMHVECFIYGNINESTALEMAGIVEKRMQETNSSVLPLLSRQLLLKREYKLNDGECYLLETENEFHKSSCSSLYLQCGVQNDQANVLIDLLAQVLSEPCYNVLRTQEQLGYIVFCGQRKSNGVQGIRIIVQSTKHPQFVETRIESFLKNMTTQLENMTDEEFVRHRDALIAQKLEKPKRLAAQFSKYLTEISLQQYHFDRSTVEAAILKTVTKEQMLDFFQTYIAIDAPHRHALSIHVISKAEDGLEESPASESVEDIAKNHILIKDLTSFKSSKELYPMVEPYIRIQAKGGKCKL